MVDAVNFERLSDIADAVLPIFRFQKPSYDFQPLPIIQNLFLAGAPGQNIQASALLATLAPQQYMTLTEEQLLDISTMLE